MKLKIATSTKKPTVMGFDACTDSLRRKLDEAREKQQDAQRILEHCATTLLANIEARGLNVHLEDALEIVHRTSLSATVAALKARGGYLAMKTDSLRVLHAHEHQQRTAPGLV